MRRSLAGAVAALAALSLAGCGGDPEVGEKPDLPTETPPLWNPCDVLDPAFIEAAFGSVAEEDDGEPAEPLCRFVPEKRTGQPVVTANYLLFAGTLDEAWETMNPPDDADISDPDIPDADDAKVVVAVVKKQLYVDGFVQNGDLVQQVEVVAPSPYDQERIVAGVERTLARLAAHAAESGVEDSE